MKKRMAIVASTVLVLLVAIGFFINERIADDTYQHAMLAADGDNEALAMELFEEACREGSDAACKALRGENGLPSAKSDASN